VPLRFLVGAQNQVWFHLCWSMKCRRAARRPGWRVTAWPARIEAAWLGRSVGEEDAVSELDRLEAALGECREMIREAHAATKDLRAAMREAKQEVRDLAADEVAARIQAEVSRQLEELGERTGEAVTAATQKVISEFDRFGESLLGKEAYWQKASGRRAAARPDTDVVPPDILPGEGKS
jgi:hypothetical protein